MRFGYVRPQMYIFVENVAKMTATVNICHHTRDVVR